MVPRRKSKKNARAGASTSKKGASGSLAPVPPPRSSTPVPPPTVAATPATVVEERTETVRSLSSSSPLLNSPNLPARFRKARYLSPWVEGTPLPSQRSGTIYNRRASIEETHNLPTEEGPPGRNEAHDDFNPSEGTISAQTPGGIPQGDVSSDPLISPLVSTNAANLSCPCKRWKPTPLIGPGHPGPSPIYCYACRTWSEAYDGGI